MSSIYDKSSLVLIPSGTKTSKVYSQKPVNGDGDFTFSRSTAATRVNADGNIEKETQNLLLQSNSFNTTWTNSGTITRTSGQSGYDGSNDAWLLTKGSAGAFIRQTNSQSGVRTFSVYAKADTADWLLLDIDGSPDAFQYFDLGNGVLGATGTNVDATITSVGGSWYRCSVTGADTYTEVRIYPAEGNNNVGGTTTQLYIQDAQLEQGMVARDVITTTTAAVEGGITDNVPRLDYTDSSCPALLLEPQRTNLVTQSEYIDSWGKNVSGGTLNVTSNYGISPDGSKNATRIQASLTGGFVDMVKVISVSSGSAYTYSVYLKSLSGTPTIAFLSDGIANRLVTLTTEWERYTFVIPSAGSLAYPRFLIENNVTSSSADYLAWGAQLEAGSYATSYIPTYGTSVTRNEDVNNAYNVSSLIGQTEGTLYLEFVVGQTSDFQVIFQTRTTNTTTSNVGQIDIRFQNGSIRALGNDGGVNQFNINGGAISLGDVVKCAVAYQNNNSTFYVNGNQAATDTNCSFTSSVLDDITFNERAAIGTSYIQKQFIKQALLFKTRLSNEELAALTTI